MEEAYLSRDGQRGESTSFDVIYYTFGESDELVAADYVIANKPATYNGYNFRTLSHTQVSDTVYVWTLNYGSAAQQITVGLPTLSFHIGGGSSHITNSLNNTRYRDASLLPDDMDFRGAIGVEISESGNARVRGIEVHAPVLEYSYAIQFENSDITDSYIDAVFNTVGMNDADFYGRPAGSVLFKGCHGTRKGSDKWELTFDFAYSPNGIDIPVGGITVSTKRGWDYLDVLYVANGNRVNGLRVMLPGQATVHQVYPLTNFANLGIGTF